MRAFITWAAISLLTTWLLTDARGDDKTRPDNAGKSPAATGAGVGATPANTAQPADSSAGSVADSPADSPADSLASASTALGRAIKAAPGPTPNPGPGAGMAAATEGVMPIPTTTSTALPDVYDMVHNSVSCGSANRGALSEAATLPRSGLGFDTPDPWWSRGRRHGTDELIGVITRAAARVDEQHPGGTLGVADLSARKGGAIPGHRSHQSGRDADLIYYALDAEGRPFQPDEHMAYYARSGRASHAKAPEYAGNIPQRYFDMPRNWALVKALMTDAEAPAEHIFVSERVRDWLLRYAERTGEPKDVLQHARRLLKRPHSTGGHNDHMHIRVSCAPDDMALGRCKNSIARKRGRQKFYSRVRCPNPPRVDAAPVTPSPRR